MESFLTLNLNYEHSSSSNYKVNTLFCNKTFDVR